MTIPAYVDHNPRDGVLCWGGPKHGTVVAVPDEPAPVLFPMPVRPPTALFEPVDQTTPWLSTVRYDRGKFAWPQPDAWHVWPVLIYGENRRYHERGLESAVHLVRWLCNPLAELDGTGDNEEDQ